MASPLTKVNTLWQAVGGAILAPILVMLIIIDGFMYSYLTTFQTFLFLNLAFLFFQEFEGYILNPNGLQGFFNKYKTGKKRAQKIVKPMSEQLILTVNGTAWGWAILAATLANTAPWIGVSFLITNSLVNILSHTVLFQLHHKSYNPGLITVVFLFIPLYTAIVWYSIAFSVLSPSEWTIAILIGIGMALLMSAALRARKK